jgi:hypothetical protein
MMFSEHTTHASRLSKRLLEENFSPRNAFLASAAENFLAKAREIAFTSGSRPTYGLTIENRA